jgi:hypothetical protein
MILFGLGLTSLTGRLRFAIDVGVVDFFAKVCAWRHVGGFWQPLSQALSTAC